MIYFSPSVILNHLVTRSIIRIQTPSFTDFSQATIPAIDLHGKLGFPRPPPHPWQRLRPGFSGSRWSRSSGCALRSLIRCTDGGPSPGAPQYESTTIHGTAKPDRGIDTMSIAPNGRCRCSILCSREGLLWLSHSRAVGSARCKGMQSSVARIRRTVSRVVTGNPPTLLFDLRVRLPRGRVVVEVQDSRPRTDLTDKGGRCP